MRELNQIQNLLSFPFLIITNELSTYLHELLNLTKSFPLGLEITTIILAYLLFQILSFLISLIFAYMKKLGEKTKTDLDDKVVEILYKKKWLLLVPTSAFISILIIYGDVLILERPLSNWFSSFFILYIGLIIAELADLALLYFFDPIAKSLELKREQIFPLTRMFVKLFIWIAILIILLSRFGVEISPLLAGLGIGGLAIGLALQDTLSNFFAGLYIISNKVVKIGDFISVGGNENLTGKVKEITWRSTRIDGIFNAEIIIPNKKIGEEIIFNYGNETERHSFVISNFSVSYGTKISELKKIFEKVVEKLKEEGLCIVDNDRQPKLRLMNFGSDGLEFRAILPVPHFSKRLDTLSRFNELLLEELNKANIEIPYPQRVLHLRNIDDKIMEKLTKIESKKSKNKKN